MEGDFVRNKINMAIAGAKFLSKTIELDKQMKGMTDDEYQNNPIGLEIQPYVLDLRKHCPRMVVDIILDRQYEMIDRLGEEYIKEYATMPYL